MSFSFSVRGATKAAAKEAVSAHLATVVEQQPIHERDRPVAQATADAVIDQLADDEARDISVTVHGSIVVQDDAVTTATVGAAGGLVDRD